MLYPCKGGAQLHWVPLIVTAGHHALARGLCHRCSSLQALHRKVRYIDVHDRFAATSFVWYHTVLVYGLLTILYVCTAVQEYICLNNWLSGLRKLAVPEQGQEITCIQPWTIFDNPLFPHALQNQRLSFPLDSRCFKTCFHASYPCRQMAVAVLSRVGRKPHNVLLASMFVATFASMWISNVAAPVLCFSLVQPILR